ncbi:MAG: hypothetical protein HOV80_15975 [Polyangiaceae bacterium]|nr:hypothetical protein [Polyangiaceae bacterium]
MQNRPSVVPIVTVATLIAAWLAADYFRIGMFDVDRWLRPWVLGGAVLAGALVAFAVDRLKRAEWGRGAYVAAALLPVVLAPLVPFASPHGWTPYRTPGDGALSALTVGLASGPPIAVLAFLTYRGSRARAHSLVADADARAPWVLLAVLAIFAMRFVAFGAPQLRSYAWAAVELTVVLAVALLVLLGVVLAGDLLALVRLTGVVNEPELRDPVTMSELAFDDRVIDAGIGDSGRRAAQPGGAYRSADVPASLVLLGDVKRCSGILAAAVARDVAALMFAVVWLATIDLQPLTVGVTPRW